MLLCGNPFQYSKLKVVRNFSMVLETFFKRGQTFKCILHHSSSMFFAILVSFLCVIVMQDVVTYLHSNQEL